MKGRLIAAFVYLMLMMADTQQLIAQWGSSDIWQSEYSRQKGATFPDQLPHAEKVTVDASGDFAINIPLLSIPGRNGLNFEWTLRYSPGVCVLEKASWVGLGWQLEVGSIRRVPILTMDQDVDLKLNNGALYEDYRDCYSISFPEGTGTIVQIPVTDGSDSFTFQIDHWRDWKITYDKSKERFVVVTENGKTYVFGMGLAGLTSNVIYDDRPMYWGFVCPAARPFMEWKLTAILGADYVGGGSDPLDPLSTTMPGINNQGSWVAVVWDAQLFQNDPKKWNYKNDLQNRQVLLEEITYPFRIITPTYVAECSMEMESANEPNLPGYVTWPNTDQTSYGGLFYKDQNPGGGFINRRLSQVSLYRYSGSGSNPLGSPLSRVQFSYEVGSTEKPNQRTTLSQVQVFGNDGSSLPPYTFDYYNSTTDIPFLPHYGYNFNAHTQGRVGANGWYNGHSQFDLGDWSGYVGLITDGKAWNLKSIQYPTGGAATFDYESDYYTPIGSQGPSPNLYGNGIRLHSQTISNGMSSSITYTYSYSCFNQNGTESLGRGIVYQSPLRYFRLHNVTDPTRQIVLDRQLDERVLYERILESNSSDQSTVARWYNVRKFDDFPINEPLSDDPTIIKGQTLDLDGSLRRIEWYDNAGCLVKFESNSRNTTVRFTYRIGGGHPYFLAAATTSETKTSKLYSQNGSRWVENVITTTFSPSNGLPITTTQLNSDRSTLKITRTTYPDDFQGGPGDNMTTALYLMRAKHMRAFPIEYTISSQVSGGPETFEGAELTLYSDIGNQQILPSARYALDASASLTDFIFASITAQGTFAHDSRYALKESYDKYLSGSLTQTSDSYGVPTAIYRTHDNAKLPIAIVKNARASEVNLVDFEDGTMGDWSEWYPVGTISNEHRSGVLSWHMDGGTNEHLTKTFAVLTSEIDPSKKYKINAWVKTTSSNPRIACSVYSGTTWISTSPVNAAGTGVWQRLEATIDLSQYSNVGLLQIVVQNGDGTHLAECWWDDIQIVPAESQIIRAIYDPLSMQVSDEIDESENIRRYEYDGLGRISRTMDNNSNVLERFNYLLAGSSISATNPNSKIVTHYRSISDFSTVKTFFDGYGRRLQEQNATGTADIVSHFTYDQMGRLSRVYKPYQYVTGHAFELEGNVSSHASSYYNSNVYGVGLTDFNPFSIREYLPDGRIDKMKPEGSVWQSGHYVLYAYDTNTPADNTGYSEFQLYKTTTYNENNDYSNPASLTTRTLEYRDKFGNLVQSVSDSAGLHLSSSFVYDIKGHVTSSTPPRGGLLSTTFLYNTLGQLTQKTSPDAGTVQYLYDKKGRLRLSKDANHNGVASNAINVNATILGPRTVNDSGSLTMPGKITFSAYGVAGSLAGSTCVVNIIKNGIVVGSLTANSAAVVTSSVSLPIGSISYSVTVGGGYSPVYAYSITCTNGLEFVYSKYDALDRVIETGEYQSDCITSFTSSNADDLTFPASGILLRSSKYDVLSTDAAATSQRNLQGKLSQENIYRSGTLVFSKSYSYDERGRVEWIVFTGLGSGSKKLYFSYDWQGNLIKKVYADLSVALNYYTSWYEHDEPGRLARIYSGVDSSSRVKEGEYIYSATGMILESLLGASPAQTVTMTYNERNWITQIACSQNGMTTFQETLGYRNSQGNGISSSAQYNGNISWMTWRTASLAEQRGYSFTYDKANRLLNATPYRLTPPTFVTASNYGMSLTYDGNGNIASLNRTGFNSVPMDELTYSYPTINNRIDHISDVVSSTSFTRDIDSQPEGNYTYDGNGNIRSDVNNGILFISYDINNLPTTEYRSNGTIIQFINDGSGSRVYKGDGALSTWYVPGDASNTEVVLSSSQCGPTYNIWGNDFVGQVRRTGSALSRYYYLHDHLGSIRVTVRGDSIVLADDFNGSLSNWSTVIGGGFSIIDGELSNSAPGSDNVAINNSPALFADGIVAADVKNLSGGQYADANLVVRYRDPNNYYLVQAYGYQVILFKKVAGTYYAQQSVYLSTLFDGGPYRLQTTVSGRTFQVYWKGQLAFTWTDPDTSSIWRCGKVGVRQCLGRNIRWDNFTAVTTCPGQVYAYDDFYPFGQTMDERSYNLGLADDRYKFTGKERDTETGYDYFGARYFDAKIGRFLSVDPHSSTYPSLSPFTYVGNNPMAFVDPMGADSASDAAAARERHRRSAVEYSNWANIPILGVFFRFIQAAHEMAAGSESKAAETLNQFGRELQIASMGVMLGIGAHTATESFLSKTTVAPVNTPRGLAYQESTPQALAARDAAARGTMLYRQGEFGAQEVPGYWWSFDNPLSTPNYQSVMGMPPTSANWVMGATLKDGAAFVTRSAPGIGTNLGGAMEVVAPQDAVRVQWFHVIGVNQ